MLANFTSDCMLSHSKQFMNSDQRENLNLSIHDYIHKRPSVTAKYSRNTFVLHCVFCSSSVKKEELNFSDLQEAEVIFNLWSFRN